MRFFFIATAFCSLSLAQLTITADDFWEIGDRYELLGVVADSLLEGPEGTGQHWTFNNLILDPSVDRTVEIVTPVSTFLSSSYPDATHVEFEDLGGSPSYVFYQVSQAEVTLLGAYGPGVNAIYTNGATFFPFPMQYGVESDDTFSASFMANGVQVNRTGTIETECDATGTLTLQGVTFNNVIRIRSEQHITDVAGGTTIETETKSYSFFVAEDTRWPVFSINYVEANFGGFSTESKAAFYRNVGATPPPPTNSFTRMVPHMTSPTGGFEAELIFWNSASGQNAIRVRALDASGGNLGDEDLILGPHEIRREQVSNLFAGTNPTHFGLSGDSAIKSVIAYRAASGLAATAHIAEDDMHSKEFWVYPGEWDLIFDGMALVNSGSSNAVVTAELIGDINSSLTLDNSLEPNGKYISTFDALFANASGSIMHIESNQKLAATFLKGTYLGNEPSFLYANTAYPEVDSSFVERWIPHITREAGGFETELYLLNTSNSSQVLTLTGYLSNGAPGFAQGIPLQPGELRRVPATDLFTGVDVSHVSALANGRIIVTAAYRALSGQAASAFVHQSAQTPTEMLVFLGEKDLVFDGMAAVNVGNASTSIRAELLSESGSVLETQTLIGSLAARAKTLAVFGDTFSNSAGFAVRIVSDEPLSAIYLRGTYVGADPAFLFANPALSD